MPLISVVVAAYNRARFLRAAVRSALSQSVADSEVIIVDDASTDSTAEVAKELASEDARVRLLQMPLNVGPSAARNAALDVARGQYVAILDADDVCMPGRFERQLEFLQETGTDLCGSWFVEFGRGMARTVRWPHTEAGLRAAMLFQYTILHPSVMARRVVFERFRYRPEFRLAEDYDLCSRAMSEFRVANVPEVLVRYRRHAGQATLARRAEMEDVTCRIRIGALEGQGIQATADERRLHNLIRAPSSNMSMADFEGIEAWLMKLTGYLEHPDAVDVIASQWTRAAVRAAPLGLPMWRRYRASPLRAMAGRKRIDEIDLAALALLRLQYGSPAFEALRRFGLGV